MADPSYIGRYAVQRRLGSGGMGTVYLCRHPSLDRLAAVKVPSEAVRADPTALARFGREAKQADGLRHEHIVVVQDADLENDPPYLAMDYVDGSSLADLLRGRVLDVESTVALLAPIAAALDHCHARGRVHRDVKPGNVIIGSRDGRDWPVLVDFGLVLPDGESPLSATGMLHGTLPYISPEQVAGRRAGPASDQYALACTVFECLTGGPPFRRSGEVATLLAHQSDQPPRLSAVLGRAPSPLDDVVDRALAKDPAARYPTVTAFVAALEDAAATTELPGPAPHRTLVLPPARPAPRAPRPEPAPPRRAARPVGALLAAALVAGAGGIAAYAGADALVDRTPPPADLAFTDGVDGVLKAGAVLSPAQRALLEQGPLGRLSECEGQEPQNAKVLAAVGCRADFPGVDGLLLRQAEPASLTDVLDSESRPPGECATQVGVDGTWAQGPLSCYDNNAGVAALQWGYADRGLFLVAVRDDGDNAGLWQWWSGTDWRTPAGPPG